MNSSRLIEHQATEARQHPGHSSAPEVSFPRWLSVLSETLRWTEQAGTGAGRKFRRSRRHVPGLGALLYAGLCAGPLWAGTPPGQVVSWGTRVLPSVPPGVVFTNVAAGFDHSLAVTSAG